MTAIVFNLKTQDRRSFNLILGRVRTVRSPERGQGGLVPPLVVSRKVFGEIRPEPLRPPMRSTLHLATSIGTARLNGNGLGQIWKGPFWSKGGKKQKKGWTVQPSVQNECLNFAPARLPTAYGSALMLFKYSDAL